MGAPHNQNPAGTASETARRKLGSIISPAIILEQLQEMFFARKADLVADDHWRAMHWLMRGFFGPEIDRVSFESFVEMGWVTPEFAKFGREFSASGIWKDPLDRLKSIQGRPVKPETP